MKGINPGHYLSGCRMGNWLRLLKQNDFRIRKESIPQALYITALSALLSPVACVESAIYDKRIRAHQLNQDPVFILGHWRSGTTYLQNIMTRDEQFAWADPVSTNLMPVSMLLGKPLAPLVGKNIRGARPMDNLSYRLDLPMEETFALLTMSDMSIIHMIAFPENYKNYIPCAFVADLPLSERLRWAKEYHYVLQKLSYRKGGKQLLLKSPDNTAHLKELTELYPDARYVNIHRDPYTTIQSSIHMFRKQMDALQLSPGFEGDLQTMLEDTFVEIFGRMYRDMLAIKDTIPANRFIDIPYAEFCKAPMEHLEKIYTQLELDGFEKARPAFEAYAAQQKNYVRNKFDCPAHLRKKIDDNLGFYFDYYGYRRMEDTANGSSGQTGK